MKKPLLLSLILLSALLRLNAQMLTPVVIGTAGGYSTASWGSLSYNIGEIAVETLSPSIMITQGFEQPNDVYLTRVNTLPGNEWKVNCYPDPAIDYLNIQLTAEKPAQIRMSVFNVLGNSVMQSVRGTINAGENSLRLNLQTLSAGLYIIELTDESGHAMAIFKANKK
jgi:hypothetical protein